MTMIITFFRFGLPWVCSIELRTVVSFHLLCRLALSSLISPSTLPLLHTSVPHYRHLLAVSVITGFVLGRTVVATESPILIHRSGFYPL